MKTKLLKVLSSSTKPNIYTITISTTFTYSLSFRTRRGKDWTFNHVQVIGFMLEASPNTSMMMEPILLITNIKCQKLQAIKICFNLMCSPNEGQLLNMMFINNNKLKENKIFVLREKVDKQLIYVRFY